MADDNLSPGQDRALTALLNQPSIRLAAAEAGVGERTLYTWLAEDRAFKAAYRRMRKEVMQNAIFQLQKATNNAVNALLSVMNDPEAAAHARVSAAREVLARSFDILNLEEMEERLAALEAVIQKPGRPW